jgi:hypothetical protein
MRDDLRDQRYDEALLLAASDIHDILSGKVEKVRAQNRNRNRLFAGVSLTTRCFSTARRFRRHWLDHIRRACWWHWLFGPSETAARRGGEEVCALHFRTLQLGSLARAETDTG